ncbi:hypothetical protein [Pseudobutyrivibrio sp.]|uniref:hypothetical protein n=1 Tax=Pseudobutyrivibrio sp. TaxID=2014367 RepID=UPI001B425E24|nr:hypothetical protein [Pseudobutyrivibrio sp.]MBP3261047.1 hypothetical protein [Pseudobutyrivibrio sp.]
MQPREDSYCYLCAYLHGDYSDKYTEEHHVFHGTANRKLAEKYGLKVNLCTYHHTAGLEAVHLNNDVDKALQKKGQMRFEEVYTDLDFQSIFGINYLDEYDRVQKQSSNEPGFRFI